MSPVRLSSATKRCARVRLRAPARDRGADDHQVAVDDRRHRPAAVGGERGELLADRALPQQLAVLAERDDRGADAERVDVAGLRIGGRRGPADAVRRHVALEDVELVFPDDLAGVGVERHHALLQLRAAAGRVLDVDAVAHHDRRRAAAVGNAPQEVLAVERPLLDEAGFLRECRRGSDRAASGQSPTATPAGGGAGLGRWAEVSAPKASASATKREAFFSMLSTPVRVTTVNAEHAELAETQHQHESTLGTKTKDPTRV